ncbi:disulfide bond formation protein DsbA, partial [Paracoccus aestuarii]
VLRYTPFHEGSDEAVRILEAARRQDKFEPVLDALFEKQPEWANHGAPDLGLAWRVAGAVGLDLERARSDRLHPDTTAILNQDVADLQELGVRATPTFFLDGRPLTNLNFDTLSAAVRNAVAEIR